MDLNWTKTNEGQTSILFSQEKHSAIYFVIREYATSNFDGYIEIHLPEEPPAVLKRYPVDSISTVDSLKRIMAFWWECFKNLEWNQ